MAALVVWLGEVGGPLITGAINDLLGTGDDVIGDRVYPLGPKSLLEFADGAPIREQDIEFDFGGEGQPISGGGGSYKTYFDVLRVPPS